MRSTPDYSVAAKDIPELPDLTDLIVKREDTPPIDRPFSDIYQGKLANRQGQVGPSIRSLRSDD